VNKKHYKLQFLYSFMETSKDEIKIGENSSLIGSCDSLDKLSSLVKDFYPTLISSTDGEISKGEAYAKEIFKLKPFIVAAVESNFNKQFNFDEKSPLLRGITRTDGLRAKVSSLLKSALVENCGSFPHLIIVVGSFDYIPSSSKGIFHGGKDQAANLLDISQTLERSTENSDEMLNTLKIPLSYITSQYGIREKVKSFIIKKSKKKSIFSFFR
jgi:hypothetical protein